MVSVKVCYKESGKAAKGIGVSVSFDGQGASLERNLATAMVMSILMPIPVEAPCMHRAKTYTKDG
jgi:hypothetical protein